MNRCTYIDAMRGLAMIMVVVYHVSYGCFHSDNIITTVLNIQLELPLFFFISGFFANKMIGKGYFSAISSKAKFLLFPTLLMMCLYCWVLDIDYFEGLNKRLKEGYWFTIVLFEFCVLFLSVDYLCQKLKLAISHIKLVHLIIAIAFIFLSSFSEKYNAKYPIINTFTIGEFTHYFYFVLGYLFYPQQERLFIMINKKINVMATIIIAFIILNVIHYKYGFAFLRLGAMLTVNITISLGLLIIWTLFNRYKQWGGGKISCDCWSKEY